MGALRELSDMTRDYGLGNRYFLLVGAILAALLVSLFLWGRVDDAAAPEKPVVPQSVTQPAPSPAASY